MPWAARISERRGVVSWPAVSQRSTIKRDWRITERDQAEADIPVLLAGRQSRQPRDFRTSKHFGGDR